MVASCLRSIVAGTIIAVGPSAAPGFSQPLIFNDDCCEGFLCPVLSTGSNGTFNNTGAQTSSLPWSCGILFAGSDVWFNYTASCTGPATIDTCCPVFATCINTALEVFIGPCSSLLPLGCNDDGPCPFSSTSSSVTVSVTAGSVYRIRIGGVGLFGGQQGDFPINISCVSYPSDECAGAIPVFDGHNLGLTNSGAATGIPWSCAAGAADTWYAYTATCTGMATFDTCGPSTNFDTVLQVFSGSCGSLSSLGCNDNACGTGSSVTVPVTAGNNYYIRVGGAGGAQGTFELGISCILPNDECAGAVALPTGLTTGLTNVGATTSFSWPCGMGGNDVWFSWTATCSGNATFDTCQQGTATVNTTLEVFSGSCGSLTSLGCSSGVSCNGILFGGSVTVPVTAGTIYLIRLGGEGGATGDLELDITCPLPNDACGGAIAVATGLNPGLTNFGASTSSSWPCGSGANDTWFSYSPNCTGNATFDTCSAGTTFDTTLEVFSGPCGSLVSLGCNNDACASRSSVTVPVTAGNAYLLRVGGAGGAVGYFDLNIVCASVATCVVFSENFGGGGLGAYTETDAAGAPAATQWHGEAQCSPGSPIPSTMGTTAAAYNRGDLGVFNYATGASPNSGAIESPVIVSSTAGTYTLAFEYTKETGDGGSGSFDQCFVEVRPAGGAYTVATQVTGNSPCPSSVAVVVNLTALAGGSWQHRLRFDTVDGLTNSFQGWYVDNVVATQTATTGGSLATVPTGCGAATMAARGLPVVGGTVTFSLVGVTGIPLLWLGPSTFLPLCSGCALGAGLGVVLPTSSLIAIIPCSTSLIGGTISIQGADLLAPGGCPAGSPVPVSFTVTHTIDLTIG